MHGKAHQSLVLELFEQNTVCGAEKYNLKKGSERKKNDEYIDGEGMHIRKERLLRKSMHLSE